MTFDFDKELDGLEGGRNDKGYKPTFESYIDQARFNFETQGKKMIALIQSGSKKGNWFEVINGRYKVTLKNGITALELRKGYTFWWHATAESACEFIAKAIVAVEGGEFDAHLTASKRVKKADADKAVNAVVEKVKSNGSANGARHAT